jgi:hypothetical protein
MLGSRRGSRGGLPIALLLLSVSACASNTIDVTRRASLPALGKDAPFIVLLTKEQENEEDYVHYAQLLVTRLEAGGLVAADTSAHARYAVMLARSEPRSQQGDESAGSISSDDMGSAGSGHSFGGGGMGGGRHGGHGMGRSQAAPERGVLRIAMFDLTKPRSAQERVFYAEVRAPAERQNSEAVVDVMIDAALKDFPGKPRESYTEPLPPQPVNGDG